MAFVKGQVANPNGRPKGSRNRKDVIALELTKQAITDGIMPLDFFLSNLRNPELPMAFRHDNAKAAAPYVHRKMPIAIENLDAPFRVLDMAELAGLTDEELAVVEKLMDKAAQAAAAADRKPERLDPRVTQQPAPKPKPKPRSK